LMMPSLEAKKKALKDLRDLHKPLDHDEMQEWRQKLDSEVEKKTKDKIKERIDRYDQH